MAKATKPAKTETTEDLELEGADPRVYEIGYHVLPSFPEERLSEESAKLKEAIVSFGGVILSEEEPRLMALAYPIDKTIENKRTWFESAFFGWIKFEAGPEAIGQLKKLMEEDTSILRFIMVKTVRENTIVKKSVLAARKLPGIELPEGEDTKSSIAAIPTEVNEAEIDKQIEDLVVE